MPEPRSSPGSIRCSKVAQMAKGNFMVNGAMPAQFIGAGTKSATKQIRLPDVKVGINRNAPKVNTAKLLRKAGRGR